RSRGDVRPAADQKRSARLSRHAGGQRPAVVGVGVGRRSVRNTGRATGTGAGRTSACGAGGVLRSAAQPHQSRTGAAVRRTRQQSRATCRDGRTDARASQSADAFPMKLSQVDLNLFVVFDTIYSEQNLTRAAEILHITQPAVSNALNRLRDTVDDPLFVRTAKGMRPTPVAQNLIEPVRAALRQFESCLQSRDQFDPATASRVFRINAGDIAEPMFLPALARHFENHCPGLRLEVLFVDRSEAPLEMAAGNLDIAIDAPLLSHPELNSIRLLRDDYVCALRRDHPLAQSELTLENYLSLRHIHISSRVRGPGHVDIALRASGQRRDIA